ncbi:unnamed protein product [Ilex paraguariensis]|uniref:Protein kinase domain-containing protein n=1 Tax=Ilex paraguariensis TaxID=185542 RepID=A0ABC8S464_9AQUA
MPNLWSYEFYLNWKEWIVPRDAVLVESNVENNGFFSVLSGRIVQCDGLIGCSMSCLLKENQLVSLVRVGSYLGGNESKFRYSYVAKIMSVLYGMRDGERSELGLLMGSSLKQCRMCRVFGLWYNTEDWSLYVVSERYGGKHLNDLENGSLGRDEEKMNLAVKDDMPTFAIIGMELCEAASDLHSQGLILGSLSLPCFNVDHFGRLYMDLNEVMVLGRRVSKMIAEVVRMKLKSDDKELDVLLKMDALKIDAFVSPEMLLEFLQKESVELASGCLRYAVGYGSDVWSLACLLICLLIRRPFTEEMQHYYGLFPSLIEEEGSDYMGLYTGWMEKVIGLLEHRLGSEFLSLKDILCKCLSYDPGSRPVATELWKCIRQLVIKPECDMMVGLEHKVNEENSSHCLVLGELCQLHLETYKGSKRGIIDGFQPKDDNDKADVDQVAEGRVDKDVVEGLSGSHVKSIDLKGHIDCITGLAVGGDFLFSSSFDKTICVWSLQDFTPVHSFKGHEHRVMAVVFVDEEQSLCISGDNGGGICIWGASIPFVQEPMKTLYEQKDWRYSGIHALAASGAGYFYSGSGDKTIKAWSLQDYTLSCTMSGHKSVVSALTVCNGVLYSGSWDGTIRLWCLSDHSPLTVFGEDTPGNVTSVLSLAADQRFLIVTHENGCIKIWSNDVFLKSTQVHNGAIFTVGMEGKWLFTGGWDKIVNVQELSGDEFRMDAIPIGSIACDSVITSLLYRQGKLFVGQADRIIKYVDAVKFHILQSRH